MVSGDHLVIFDPHAWYVPGATSSSQGIKIRFVNTNLEEQFPDQMSLYCLFGCNMKHRFCGTQFYFPCWTEKTSVKSEICQTKCMKEGVIDELVQSFYCEVSKYLLCVAVLDAVWLGTMMSNVSARTIPHTSKLAAHWLPQKYQAQSRLLHCHQCHRPG